MSERRIFVLFCTGACLLVLSVVFVLGGRLASACGPDRCQSARQACEAVKAHAEAVHADVGDDVIPVEFGYLADEFVEAACGY